MTMKATLIKDFFQNPIFLAAITSWVIAQIMKAFIVLLRVRRRSIRELLETVVWRTGGMPSSHAAVVSSITTTVAFREGPGSNLFVVSFFLAVIVMRDAMGVRRSSGLQGKTLNNLGRQAADKLDIEFHPLKEVHGHAPLEVIIGSLLGVIIAAALALL